MKGNLILCGLIGTAVIFTGCGSSSSGGSGSDPEPQKELSGLIIVPAESESEPEAMAFGRSGAVGRQTADDSCTDEIPGGFERVINEPVKLFDSSGGEVASSLNTDECGVFSGSVSDLVESILVEPDGFRPISAPAVDFVVTSVSSVPSLVSTIASDASYEIRSLFRQPDGRLGFNVADDKTGRPVIGLPQDAFTIEQNGTQLVIQAIRIAQREQESASIALVLDASGSMRVSVFTDDDDNTHTRWHVARDASHLFLDSKAQNDEVGVVIFDSSVDMIDDDFVGSRFSLVDSNGDPQTYTFSESGFTTNAEDLRLIVDAFDRYNNIYSSPWFGFNRDPHPDTADLEITGSYPWGRATALYDAVVKGLKQTNDRPNNRKFVVTMGDGGDNRSTNTLQETIDKSNTLGIPVFAIALGLSEASSEFANLKQLGEDTGGDFVSVQDEGAETELLNAFESIQTGLVYQYLLTLESPENVQPGDELKLIINHNGVEDERIFTVPGA